MGHPSFDSDPSMLATTQNDPPATQFIGATWAIHRVLGVIAPDDREALGSECHELVLGGLATAGTLGGVFSRQELADSSYHPRTFAPLSEDEVWRVVRAGIRGGLLTTHHPPDWYRLLREDLRGHVVALYDWLPDLPQLLGTKHGP